MRADLHDDPAVFRLSTILKIDKFSVIGRLHTFWSWVDRHSVDGRVDGAASTYVDEVVRQEGFADALAVVGWLTIDETGISVPKFDRHNGDSAKHRAQKSERQARWRANKDASVDGHVDGDASTDATTREEKRREEKEKTKRASLAVSDLVADGLTEEIAADWLAHRRSKKAPLTATAWAGVKREAQKAGWSLQAAVEKAMARGWQGFEAAWVSGEAAPGNVVTGRFKGVK
ncbi:hypothetical protein [Cupriavidus taiwanensis]|uniref:hypothetical protein n=1 Tax=Cupriavidus taiwanensis TaxID=164546 RepID=UPI0011C0694C|nr:hypothetical protein [Cupriavidus taiwanensis]